jgi:hypothetical protein
VHALSWLINQLYRFVWTIDGWNLIPRSLFEFNTHKTAASLRPCCEGGHLVRWPWAYGCGVPLNYKGEPIQNEVLWGFSANFSFLCSLEEPSFSCCNSLAILPVHPLLLPLLLTFPCWTVEILEGRRCELYVIDGNRKDDSSKYMLKVFIYTS